MIDNLSEIKAVIFDMDGVLFLSSDCHSKAYNEVLAGIGIQNFFYASVAGMRTDDAMRKILAENKRKISDDEIESLVKRKRKRAIELLEQEGMIANGGFELVLCLRGRYRLALVSSASPQTIAVFLRKIGYGDAFEFVLDGSFVKEAKPSSEIYQVALKMLNLTPMECVVVEDAVSGVLAARNAGIQVIAVLGTETSEKLFDVGAGYVASDLLELQSLLTGIDSEL